MMTDFPFSFTAVHDPDIDRLLRTVISNLGTELRDCPRGTSIFLGGSYGRGDGGVQKTAAGPRLYNDLDFFVFLPEWHSASRTLLNRRLARTARDWQQRLGIDVDFSPVKGCLELLRHGRRLIYQELKHGNVPLIGSSHILSCIPDISPEELPFSEALRLLLNRGIGLCLAGQEIQKPGADTNFILRNFNKLILGCCDALLIARHSYSWSRRRRSERLHTLLDAQSLRLYCRAEQFKCRPINQLPESAAEHWQELRIFFLRTADRIAESDGCPSAFSDAMLRQCSRNRETSLFHWLNQGRRTGRWSLSPVHFLPPVGQLLIRLHHLLTAAHGIPPLPPDLYHEWQLFN